MSIASCCLKSLTMRALHSLVLSSIKVIRSRRKMQCFYAARLEHCHPRGAIKINFCLTNGLISNYECSNGDGHMTNSIEPADDVMTFAAVLWVALCRCCSWSHLLTVLTDPWPPIFNASRIWFLLEHQAISLSFLGVALRCLPDHGRSSSIPVACKRCTRRSITEWCTPIFPATFLLLKPTCDMQTACHLSAKVNFRLNKI
jgi:hypothetical protein